MIIIYTEIDFSIFNPKKVCQDVFENVELKIDLECFSETLFGRARQVFDLLYGGHDKTETAAKIGCDLNTVYWQVKEIARKLKNFWGLVLCRQNILWFLTYHHIFV